MSRFTSRIISDLIVLGRAIPEEISDHRQTICAAGYSEELGLIRLYPTRWDSPLNRWNIVKVPVERPRKPLFDPRPESWKIEGSRSEWDGLSEKITRVGVLRKRDDRIALVESNVVGCVSSLRPAGFSLGIIKPEIEEYYYIENPKKKDLRQQTIDRSFRVMVKDDFDYLPKIKYTCGECKAKNPHDQQLLEWGFFEGMRKNPDDIEKIWEYMGFTAQEDWSFYFVVGNLYAYPKAFNIISVLRFKNP